MKRFKVQKTTFIYDLANPKAKPSESVKRMTFYAKDKASLKAELSYLQRKKQNVQYKILRGVNNG